MSQTKKIKDIINKAKKEISSSLNTASQKAQKVMPKYGVKVFKPIVLTKRIMKTTIKMPKRTILFFYNKNRHIITEEKIDAIVNNYNQSNDYEWFDKFLAQGQQEHTQQYFLKKLSHNKFKPIKKQNYIPFNKQELMSEVLTFYKSYFPNKAKIVESILNGTHPLFKDKKGNYHVTIEMGYPSGHVSAKSKKDLGSFLELVVCGENDFNLYTTLAHELAHALSERHQIDVANARKGKVRKTHLPYEQDAVVEIESIIAERLFLRYALKKGLIDKKEFKNEENKFDNMIIHECYIIQKYKEITAPLGKSTTKDDVLKYVQHLKKNRRNFSLDFLISIANKNRPISYKYRYVVGGIVADKWIKKFDQANSREKRIMLKNFSDYISFNSGAELNRTCKQLLGKDFNKLTEDYITSRKKEPLLTKTVDSLNTIKEKTESIIANI